MLDNISTELQPLKRWVVWKKGHGKNSKKPYDAATGKLASVTDSITWSTFSEAKQAVLDGHADGVGFVLTEDDPFTFIDLDDVINNGQIEPRAEKIIQRFNSYTEVSQSGRGIHILLKGKKPGNRSRSEKVEIYDCNRYFALTGGLWESHLHRIEDRQTELSEFYKEMFTDGAICDENDYKDLTDEVHLSLTTEPPTDKFKRLFTKVNFVDTWNRNRGFSSLSEYDLALSSYAVEDNWSDQEMADLIITFRKKHGEEKDIEKAFRHDYIARTITKARSGINAEYKCELTDGGNAKRLTLRHGKNLKYCYPLKKWLIWNGKRWEVDETGQIVELAKETIRSIYIQAASMKDDTERNSLIKVIRRNENSSRIKAMIELAQSEPGTPVLPKQLDTDPWKLNVSNGMIDLNTGLLHEHNRDDLITKISPVNYTPGKRSELFDNFLNRVIPDNEVKSFIQRVAGYSLYGRNVEEIMLFVYGPPASGKSTFLDAISAAMGDYAARTDFGSFLKRERASGGPRADIARLAGKRLVISQEVEEGAKLDEALVNQLTGMDTVAARHLYQESFEFLPQFTIWLAANSRPQLSSADGGIWRRIREIPFNEVIPENERDRELKDMFCEPEHNKAILNWMVEGCLAWQRQGLSVPCAVKEATEDYREEMDYVGQFLDECTYRGAGLSEGNSNLYNVYMDWCKYNRVPKLGRKSFSQNLKDRGLQQRPGKRDGRCWDGIELRLEALSDFQLNKRFLGHLRAREKVGCD